VQDGGLGRGRPNFLVLYSPVKIVLIAYGWLVTLCVCDKRNLLTSKGFVMGSFTFRGQNLAEIGTSTFCPLPNASRKSSGFLNPISPISDENFSLHYHYLFKHSSDENKGNDHQR